MMGAGKSHVGASLSRTLGLDFYDSDKLVEQRAGCAVSEVFERFGEAKFRESEKKIILGLLDKAPSVVATGGGAVVNDETLSAIKTRAVSIWLNPDFSVLFDRLKDKADRPLLQTDNPEETLRALMCGREDRYAQADVNLEITHDNQSQTLNSLIKRLSEHLNTARF